MKISLQHIGRRFNREWIFRDLSYEFTSGSKYAILGPNGSGKSTLLSIIMGNLSPSEGQLEYWNGQEAISVEKVYKSLSFAAPYLDLIEDFTLQETIAFHFKFKSYFPGMNEKKVMELLGLSRSKDKALKYFSSGMKQRTKLALACCTDSPMLLLDEPVSNLDKQGVSWYLDLIETYAADKLVIIGSNQEIEYAFCDKIIEITDFKEISI
jgi:ABC-type multidrug transport system ATPase subunit